MSEKKKTSTYEEQVEQEFKATQNDGVVQNQDGTVKDLGRVQLDRGIDLEDDPNIQRINASIGYQDVPLSTLPSRGRYLPTETNIRIRAAKVGEIREFSTMDENNMKDVNDKLTYILSQCVKVYYGNVPGSYKDIIAADRIVLILKIRELTFIDGATSIKLPVPENACKTVGCKPQSTVDFNTTSLVFNEPPEEFEKYYDEINRCYIFKTRSFGDIPIYIPSVGVNDAISDWIMRQVQDNRKIDEANAEILPFVIKDWRGLSDKMIFAKMTELSGWSTEKFTLIYRLVNELNVGIKFDITATCEKCGGEITVPITFPDGYKSIFVPTISDIRDELL